MGSTKTDSIKNEFYKMTRTLILALGLLVVEGSSSFAAHGTASTQCAPSENTSTTKCSCNRCCPDDYFRKPLPCIESFRRYESCDDYCRKTAPVIQRFPYCGTADDYCRKPFTLPCRLPRFDLLKCVPLDWWKR